MVYKTFFLLQKSLTQGIVLSEFENKKSINP